MIKIKRVQTEDLEWLREHRNDPDLFLYFNQYRELSKEEQNQWYLNLGEHFHPFIVWHENERVGYVGLRDVNSILRSAEFSIFIVPHERNKGYGRRALEFLLRYGFHTLNLMVIHSIVFDFNKAIEIYKEVGFKIDGKLRRTCFKRGRYYDSFYISMLRDEYEDRYNFQQENEGRLGSVR